MSPGYRIETASGTIDGVNRVFSTTSDYKSGTVVAILNGQSIPGQATELAGKDFELPADITPLPGDVVSVAYWAI